MYQRQLSYETSAHEVRRPATRPSLLVRPLVGALLCVTMAACTGPDGAAEAPGPDGVRQAEEGGKDRVRQAGGREPPDDMLPRFTADGELVRPEGWEGWVAAGTSMGLTYNEPDRLPEPGEPPGDFLMVYVQPWAYDHYRETGDFAEGTMFILAGAEPVRKADPARGGFYQGELVLMEVHLKREGLHESGWGFYGFGGGDDVSAPLIPGEAACYSCHRDNGAHDHVFTQFYPPMRDGPASAVSEEGEVRIRPPGDDGVAPAAAGAPDGGHGEGEGGRP